VKRAKRVKPFTISEHLGHITRNLEHLSSQIRELSTFIVPMYTKGVTIRDYVDSKGSVTAVQPKLEEMSVYGTLSFKPKRKSK